MVTVNLSQLEVAMNRIAELEAILDGDPNQTETPETRRAWRRSAVLYADKCEARITELKAEKKRLRELLDDAMLHRSCDCGHCKSVRARYVALDTPHE